MAATFLPQHAMPASRPPTRAGAASIGQTLRTPPNQPPQTPSISEQHPNNIEQTRTSANMTVHNISELHRKNLKKPETQNARVPAIRWRSSAEHPRKKVGPENLKGPESHRVARTSLGEHF
jgi:hypothetical protein